VCVPQRRLGLDSFSFLNFVTQTQRRDPASQLKIQDSTSFQRLALLTEAYSDVPSTCPRKYWNIGLLKLEHGSCSLSQHHAPSNINKSQLITRRHIHVIFATERAVGYIDNNKNNRDFLAELRNTLSAAVLTSHLAVDICKLFSYQLLARQIGVRVLLLTPIPLH
jgi:hypothetical protein